MLPATVAYTLTFIEEQHVKNKICIMGLTLIILCLAACNNRPLPNTFLIPLDYEGSKSLAIGWVKE